MTPEETIKRAMIEHGTPNWVAHVPISIRKQVSATRTVELREKYARQSATVANKHETKQSRLDKWLADNVFAHVTIAELAAVGECSKALVRRKIRNRPDVFRRIDRSTYEIRDPQSDRKTSSTNNKKETR